MGKPIFSGRVTGVSSAKVDSLEEEKGKRQKEALVALIDYYSAPDDPTGDEARTAANNRLQDAWRQEKDVAGRISGINEIRANAKTSAEDLRRWFDLL